mmetsp:Transcript_5035/g.12011  ORF Transcript_5035/g.12011 Transcript_5035/m.12011 type:complete len:246 (-) Transcript_5035:217-954(-)
MIIIQRWVHVRLSSLQQSHHSHKVTRCRKGTSSLLTPTPGANDILVRFAIGMLNLLKNLFGHSSPQVLLAVSPGPQELIGSFDRQTLIMDLPKMLGPLGNSTDKIAFGNIGNIGGFGYIGQGFEYSDNMMTRWAIHRLENLGRMFGGLAHFVDMAVHFAQVGFTAATTRKRFVQLLLAFRLINNPRIHDGCLDFRCDFFRIHREEFIQNVVRFHRIFLTRVFQHHLLKLCRSHGRQIFRTCPIVC